MKNNVCVAFLTSLGVSGCCGKYSKPMRKTKAIFDSYVLKYFDLPGI